MKLPVSLQLYSLKEEMAKDFEGTLERVAGFGYDGVEFAGYGNLTAQRMDDLLKKLKLKASGSHVSLELLKDSLQQQIAYNQQIGNHNIVCPWSNVKHKQDYIELSAFLNQTGEVLRKNGMQLFYHNHGHEFELVDGMYGIDLLWQLTDPELVKVEIDLYWVKYAGLDPLDYLRKLGSRAALLHFKDMNSIDRTRTATFGTGSIDYKQIIEQIKHDKDNAVEWLIIEQEHFDSPYLESVQIGLNNIKKMIG